MTDIVSTTEIITTTSDKEVNIHLYFFVIT